MRLLSLYDNVVTSFVFFFKAVKNKPLIEKISTISTLEVENINAVSTNLGSNVFFCIYYFIFR